MVDEKNDLHYFDEIFSLITVNTNDLIAVIESHYYFNLNYINENKFEKILGYKIDDLIGKSILDFIHPDDNRNLITILKKVNDSKEEQEIIRMKNINNKFFWFEIKAKSFLDKKKDKKILLIFKEISKIKELENIISERDKEIKTLTDYVPEIRFWKLFYPKKYEEALKISYSMLELIIENIPQNIFWKDKNLFYLGCNKNYTKLIGIDNPENVIRKTDDILFSNKNNIETIKKHELYVLKNDMAIYHNIEPWYLKNGEKRWLDTNRIPLHDFKGNNIGILVTYDDITDNVIADQKLKESEEKFRTITELSLIGITIIQDNNIKYYNNHWANIFGYSFVELMNWKLIDFINIIHSSDKDLVLEQTRIKQLGIADAVNKYQFRAYKKSGELIWVESYGMSIIYKNKPADLSVIMDITDKVIGDKLLIASEKKYREIIENITEGYFEVDLGGEIIFFNDALCQLLGYSHTELMGMHFHNYMTKERGEQTFKVFNEVFRTEIPYKSFEYELIRKDGKKLYGESSVYLRHDSQGNKIGFSGIVRDITEKREAEKKLEESEKKYRNIIENTREGYLEVDLTGTFIFFNNSFCELLNYSSDELIGMNYKNLMNEEYSNRTFKIFNEVYSTGQPFKSVEYELKKKNGIKIYVESSIYLRYDSEGDKVGFSGFVRDITEKKIAEQRLKESEEKYRNLFESSPLFIGLLDKKGYIVDCNDAANYYLSTHTKSDLIGKHFSEIMAFNEKNNYIIPIIKNHFENILKGNKLDTIEFKIFRSIGGYLWCSAQSSMVKLGHEEYIQVLMQNITEAKLAEEKLRESEERFRTISEESLLGILEYDFIRKKFSYINPRLLNILGYKSLNELDRDKFKKSIYSEDLNKFYDIVNKTDLEFRIYDKNGKLKWLNSYKTNLYDDNHKLIGFRVWIEDVTERKLYEKLIYELNVNFLNFTADVEKNIEMLLNTCCKLLNAELVIYTHRILEDGIEKYQVISSHKDVDVFKANYFKTNLILSELFHEFHDFPQIFVDIDKTEFTKTDNYIKGKNFKGLIGKLIKSENEFNGAICAFYYDNPIISHEDSLVLFLISDALEIEQRRWQVQRYLEEQNRLKTELLSRTSHELKTPLISIKGFTDLLLKLHASKLDTDMVSILEEIKEGGRRLEELINSLIKSARLDQGTLTLNRTTEDLSFLIKFCVKELDGLAELRSQNILLNTHEYLTADFDKERIYDVIANLLVNAIKYTPPKGEIIIRTEIKEKFYVVSIKDNGIGITEEEKGQLFKQFGKIERYGMGWNIGIEGSGLGLYISKKIVELHGGEIWVESEGRNKGSTFYFSIPFISE